MPGGRRAVPSVSIIVPVYDRRPELTRLTKALAAAGISGEVIVVEDRLPLNRTWLEQEQWPFELRCDLVTEGSQAAARNTGAARARGSYLIFLDSDVMPQPDSLDALVDRVAARPNGIAIPVIEQPPGAAVSLASTLFDVPAYSKAFVRHALRSKLSFRHFVSCAFAIRKADFTRLGGFATSFPCYGYEDVEFAWRAERDGISFSLVHAATVRHLKQMSPRDVLARAQDLGRSAAHLVELHPGIEDVMPLGVCDFLEGRLWYPPDFPVHDLLQSAAALERAWLDGSGRIDSRTWTYAQSVYGDLARFGRFLGIAEAIGSAPKAEGDVGSTSGITADRGGKG